VKKREKTRKFVKKCEKIAKNGQKSVENAKKSNFVLHAFP